MKNKKTIKNILYLGIIILLALVILYYIVLGNTNKNNANDLNYEDSNISETPLYNYSEEEIFVNYVGELTEGVIKDIFLNDDGSVYAYEWSTNLNPESQTFNGSICYKLIWKD